MNKKGKKGFLKKLALCAVSMSMLVGSAGCAGRAQGGPPEGRGGTAANTIGAKVFVIGKNDTVEFWDDVREGAEDACNELGLEFEYRCASGDNDYASQVGYIKEAIEWGADAIIVAPNGVTELNDALAEAQEKGIALINVNSKADFDGIAAVVRSSDKDGGTIAGTNAADILLQKNGEEGFDFRTAGTQKIGIIGHTAETANERISAFKEAFGTELGYAIEDYKSTYAEDIGDTTSRESSETAQMVENYIIEGERCSGRDTAKEEAMKLMKANPEIKVLYGTNTNTTLGICDAIKEMEQTDKVFAIGFNASEDILNYIRQGVLKGIIIQNPYNMGYLSVTDARSLISGTSVSPVLDTGVTFVSADNLNDDIIQLMLDPNKIA